MLKTSRVVPATKWLWMGSEGTTWHRTECTVAKWNLVPMNEGGYEWRLFQNSLLVLH